jgi:hypothetical protein
MKILSFSARHTGTAQAALGRNMENIPAQFRNCSRPTRSAW